MADYISQFTGLEIDQRLAKVPQLESGKQDALVSGENIKTINGQSVLGNGDMQIQAGVTDVTVGGTSVVSNGVAAVPAIPTVPTISTNVATDKADNTKTASPKAVYDEVHPSVATTQPAGGLLPNVLYNLGTLTGSVTFSLSAPSDNTIANHYFWTFEAGSTAPTITWPTGITWIDGSAPTINANKHYEISVLNGYGTYMEV